MLELDKANQQSSVCFELVRLVASNPIQQLLSGWSVYQITLSLTEQLTVHILSLVTHSPS